MRSLERKAWWGFAGSVLTLAMAACGIEAPASLSPAASPSSVPDLSAIGCATDDPEGVGGLTGAWSANTGGVYYLRQVGDCVWWFGTEIEPIELGPTGQFGYANVAIGRVDGSNIELEYADLPLGDVLGGGGLTFAYDDESGTLTLTDQRGDWMPFGSTVLTRIDPSASPDPTPSPDPTRSPDPTPSP